MKILLGFILGSITAVAGILGIQNLKGDAIQISHPNTAGEVFLKVERENVIHGTTQFSILRDTDELFEATIISNAFYIGVDGENGFNEIVFEEVEQDGVYIRTVKSNILKPSNGVEWKTVLYDPELGKIVETTVSTEQGVYITDAEGNKLYIESEPAAGGDATR